MRLTCLSVLFSTSRWITYVLVFVSVCMCRTMWQALFVMSVSQGSSTCHRLTLRVVYVVSVWASLNSAPAPLGRDIRYFAKLPMVKGGVNIFGINV